MSEMYSPMWWTQMFAIVSNVILWSWILAALFAPGLYEIINWLSRVNLRIRRKKIRARHGSARVRQDSTTLDDYTGSHHIISKKEEASE